jgi:hypothetical protein
MCSIESELDHNDAQDERLSSSEQLGCKGGRHLSVSESRSRCVLRFLSIYP